MVGGGSVAREGRIAAAVVRGLAAAALALVLAAAPAGAGTKLVSVNSAGVQGLGGNMARAISPDGRFVVIRSDARLAPDGKNGAFDLFLHDRSTHATELLSRSTSGVPGNADSTAGAAAAGGRFAAFQSSATNLVEGDTNGFRDIFLRDRARGTTRRVGLGPGGAQGNAHSSFTSLSGDGRYVVFSSLATNLVRHDTNGAEDVFVYDRLLGTTSRASLASGGGQGLGHSYGGTISADGRYVAFTSEAANLVAGDVNLVADCFVHDRTTGRTTLASLSSAGYLGNDPSDSCGISADGKWLAFVSLASNLVAGDANAVSDVFLRDLRNRTTIRVSETSDGGGDGWSWEPAISRTGRFVAFTSEATNLVAADANGVADLFLLDRATFGIRRLSVGRWGVEPNGWSTPAGISGDGRFVAFSSQASNLVDGDLNPREDAFVVGPLYSP